MTNGSVNSTNSSVPRLGSLDAYRGLIMISLAFVGFGLAGTAKLHLEKNPDSKGWEQVRYQFSHAEWVGCSYWDLIQPSFMFMVGVSMAFSYAARANRGHSYRRMLFHAISRSFILIALSIFLMSHSRNRTHWEFMNVLAQIGLGYTFLFLLWRRSLKVQWIAAGLILAGTWAVYEFYPETGIDLEPGTANVGVTEGWAEKHLQNVRDPWHKNANLGHAIDIKVLNRFPRSEPFQFNKGGYQTINFVPSIVTMVFGLMCGGLLRSDRSNIRKLLTLILGGVCGLAAGQALHLTGVCPLVKRIWTPSWVLFSTGWCCLIMAGFFGVIDMLKLRKWSFPLVVVGMNSIAIYCMSMLLKPWTAKQLTIHFGKDVFTLCGHVQKSYAPTVQAVLVGLVFWLICFYLYRKKIFLRI